MSSKYAPINEFKIPLCKSGFINNKINNNREAEKFTMISKLKSFLSDQLL